MRVFLVLQFFYFAQQFPSVFVAVRSRTSPVKRKVCRGRGAWPTPPGLFRSSRLCFWPRTVRLPRFTQPLATVPYTPRQSSHPPRAKADDRIDASRSCCPQLSRPGDKRLVQWYLQLARRAERRWWPRAGRDVPALGSGGPRHLHMRCGVCSSRTMKASRRAEQEGNSDTPMTPTGGRPAIGLQVRHEGCYCAACAPGAEAAATMATCEYSDRFGVGGRREWVESS
jgi:hypothetical protein